MVPALGVAASAGMMMAFVGFHRSALRTAFQTMCDDEVHAIEQHLETNINLLRSVQAFAQESPANDWGTMHEFVGNFSLLAKDVARYYWWNPAIAPSLVQPLEAYPEDSARVSFSVEAIRPLVARAKVQDLPAAGFLPPRFPGENPLCVVALPVALAGTEGYSEGVLLAFDAGKLIEEALSVTGSRGVQLTVRNSAGNLLYRSPARPAHGISLGVLFEPAPRQWAYSLQIAFADSAWSIEALPANRFPDTDALACWGVFAFGLLLTALIDAFVELRRREASAMRGIVRLRSRELSETRNRLQVEIAEKQSAEASLRESEDRFRKAYADAAVGIVMTDLHGCLVAVNKSACRLSGFTERQLIGASIFDLLTEETDRDETRRQTDLLLRRKLASHHAERQMRRKDGRIVWLRASISLIESDGRPAHFFALLEDITEQVESRRQLEFHASHDALTGLLNRRAFEDRLAGAIGRARGGSAQLALMYIDLDGFKFINDSLGHAIGDLLLRKVAPRLRQCLSEGEVLARVGGDEFTLIVESAAQEEAVARQAQRILHCLHQPFEVGGHELFVSASIGISVYPGDGTEAGTLVQHADAAMYRAKQEGRGRYRFFSAEMAESAAARLRMESDLRRALSHGEIEVHFQPLVDSRNGIITRFEALCRWRREGKEYVPPSRFIPVAEESGLIIPIGAAVLLEACRQAKRWNRVSVRPVRVAVNVSFVQLGQTNFVSDVLQALKSTRLSPSLLELELTESAVMRDPEQTLQVLAELRGMGVSLTLDDFGTGYSSLSHLQGIPLEAVKIDQSFVSRMTDSRRSAQLVASLIALAHGMGLEVVAEGVELPEQVTALRSLDCDLLQGFLLGHPMDAQHALRHLERTNGNVESGASLAALTMATQGPLQSSRTAEAAVEESAR
jgi:diguanylate cyclase (GGDEF)-like protein/PAS domain S-box-containing protein